MNATKAIESLLRIAGIPVKEVSAYGRQIVVTSQCRNTADRVWFLFGKTKAYRLRGIVECIDYAKENKNTVLSPSTVKVFRTYMVVA